MMLPSSPDVAMSSVPFGSAVDKHSCWYSMVLSLTPHPLMCYDRPVPPQEDLILPHHYSFHELIINKARGKSGPLFDFGVKDDIRLLHDANVESQDVHAGKVRWGEDGGRACL